MAKDEVILYNKEDTVTRSNALIGGMYSSTLIENKLTVWALKAARADADGLPTVSMTTEEIRALTGTKGNGIYDLLAVTALRMGNRHIFIEDRDKHEFEFINLIDHATYKGGIFTVFFTQAAKARMWNLKSNFTTMRLETLFAFKSNYTFRLYELLKMHEYQIDGNNTPIIIEYGFAELKLKMNLVDTDKDEKVFLALKKKNCDLDKIVNEIAGENNRKFRDWYEFKRKVIQRAQKEINETTELHVDVEPVRSGRGGRVTKLRFILTHNPDFHADGSQHAKVSDVLSIMPNAGISEHDAIALLKAAGDDLGKIRAAYDKAKKQPELRNLVGWMISCLKGDYQSVSVIEGDAERYKQADQLKNTIKSYHEQHADELAILTWNRMKENERFPMFEEHVLQETGLEMYFWETLYSPIEKIKIFSKWLQT